MRERLMSMMGLCKRAGQLVAGFDPVKGSVLSGKALLVLTACDLSEKTKKEVSYLLEEEEIPCYDTGCTLDEFAFYLGKRTGVYCVEDENFAKKLEQLAHPAFENEEESSL